MKIIHTLALTALSTALAAGTAFAQDPQPTTPPTAEPQAAQSHDRHDKADKPSFDQLDTRGEGSITRADLAAHPKLLEKFDDIDTAGDGSISRAEYEAWKAQKKSRDGGSSY